MDATNQATLSPLTWALRLKSRTSESWLEKVLSNFDFFLQDHATCERKASATALGFVVKFKNNPRLVDILTDVAIEELDHFRMVKNLLAQRGLEIGGDDKDLYVKELLQLARNDNDGRMLDRLIIFGIIEARAAERFGLIARHHSDPVIQKFYHFLATAEAKHQAVFIDLALEFFPNENVHERVEYFLNAEAALLEKIPNEGRLH